MEEEIMKTPLFENMRKLVNVIDELRDVGLQQHISLPRIAVLGTQSSGKSSLLESIVGLDFLPRGEGVVTRRPLELRLVHVPGGEETKPWAVFEDLKSQKFSDFDKVRATIDELTDKKAGQKKNIIPDPIVLTIYSSSCPDLTIIDLPGITRIPLAGSEQPKDIEKITRDMALKYVKEERTIILCVIPANADISTSDALQMARELDPEGNRTIGVITKIDIMDKGTNAKRMILGQDINLKLGYVGVKNRSQQDIHDKMRVGKALELEAEYFSKNPVYSTMPPGYLGTKALTNKLTTVMFNHIRKFLPAIVKEISQKIKECEDRLKDLGPPLPREEKEKIHLLWKMITNFTENFKNSIRGKYDGSRSVKVNKELSGGAIIKVQFNKLLENFTRGEKPATNEYSDKDIERAITLHQGDSLPGFPSIDAFLYLIQPQLEKLKEPALDCLHNVFAYLENLSSTLIEKLFARFPAIVSEISEITSKVLQEEREKAKQVVVNIIDSELGYLFTNDLDYLSSRTSIIPKQDNKEKPVDANKLFIMELRARIDSYFQLVVRNVRDSIPKAIGFFLVKASQEKMQYSLYNEIMKNEELMQFLGEPPHIANERDTITKTLSVLTKAQKVLKRDPDLAAIDKGDQSDDKPYPPFEKEQQRKDDFPENPVSRGKINDNYQLNERPPTNNYPGPGPKTGPALDNSLFGNVPSKKN